ncbi:MAG TPA: hypothetical protein VIC86_05540 [Acidimicrobiales bacterium]|jgi:hypothetical protein
MNVQVPVRPAEPADGQAPPSPEALIREARRRQRRRQAVILGVVAVIVAAGVVALDAMRTDGSTPRAGLLNRPGPEYPVSVPGPFTGSWRVHTTVVTIESNGRGTATWPGPLGPGQSEATATPGHADFRVTGVSGTHGIGLVSGSTEPSVLANGPIRLLVSSQDLLYITQGGSTAAGPILGSGLCGPSALALPLAQQVAGGINCGA